MSSENVIGWMFDSRDNGSTPIFLDQETGGRSNRRKMKRKRRKVSKAAVTCIVLALAMFAHEWAIKSFSNALVLVMLLIYAITLLYVGIGHCEHRIKSNVARDLFVMGFGPAFVLLFVLTLVFFLAMLGYYCYGADCTNLDQMHELRSIQNMLLASPFRGIMFAFLVSFVNAAFLEETIKLIFVKNSIEFVTNGQGLQSGVVPVVPQIPATYTPLSEPNSPFDEESALEAGGLPLQPVIYQPDPTLEIIQADTTKVVTSRQGIVLYFLAFSLGLALAESMLYVCCFAKNPNDGIRISLYRMCFSIPMHAACGCLTALGLVERYIEGISILRVLFPSVVLHGFFDFFHLVPVNGILDPATLDFVKHVTSVAVLGIALYVLWKRFETHHIKLFSMQKI